jgi:hypothetical protein
MAQEHEALELFGELLIRQVRDVTITHWDKILDGRMKGPPAQRATERLASFNEEQRETIRRLIADVTDTALHYLLWTLEQDSARVSVDVRMETGVVSNMAEVSGDFPAELYDENGWIARFSKERFFDILGE